MKFVDCTNCNTTLLLPKGAQSMRCAICCAVVSTDTTESRKTSRLTTYMNNYFPMLHGRTSPAAGQKIQPPPAFGRKRALIIGITYKNTKDELQGCINDAKCMNFLLVNRFKFPQEAVIMLTGKISTFITTTFLLPNIHFYCQRRSQNFNSRL